MVFEIYFAKTIIVGIFTLCVAATRVFVLVFYVAAYEVQVSKLLVDIHSLVSNVVVVNLFFYFMVSPKDWFHAMVFVGNVWKIFVTCFARDIYDKTI